MRATKGEGTEAKHRETWEAVPQRRGGNLSTAARVGEGKAGNLSTGGRAEPGREGWQGGVGSYAQEGGGGI